MLPMLSEKSPKKRKPNNPVSIEAQKSVLSDGVPRASKTRPKAFAKLCQRRNHYRGVTCYKNPL